MYSPRADPHVAVAFTVYTQLLVVRFNPCPHKVSTSQTYATGNVCISYLKQSYFISNSLMFSWAFSLPNLLHLSAYCYWSLLGQLQACVLWYICTHIMISYWSLLGQLQACVFVTYLHTHNDLILSSSGTTASLCFVTYLHTHNDLILSSSGTTASLCFCDIFAHT